MGKENENLLNFLLFSYFGFSLSDLKQYENNKKVIAEQCASQAYLDFCRTIKYTGKDETKQFEQAKKQFRQVICEKIAEEILKMLSESESTNFDHWHKETCCSLKKYINENLNSILKEDFYYGQVQKWLNMTIKYMFLLGLWNEEFKNIESELHVAVDNYILKAISDKSNPYNLKPEKILKPTEPWSRWDCCNYTNFQTALKKAMTTCDKRYKNPIEWESMAWIEQAKIEAANRV